MFNVRDVATVICLLSILLTSSSVIYISLAIKEHRDMIYPKSNINDTKKSLAILRERCLDIKNGKKYG